MGLGVLISAGVIIHLVLFISIFDIYFTSPITRGVEPLPNYEEKLSKRVVVVSIDGLRFDALMENDENDVAIAPYIRWSMSHRGTWGVSHTHLPTETRPGHVAMLAGFYEDPSAVTKGWKQNPVDFDSIFNQSVCSFAWGSPDVVDIFYKDLKHECSYKFTYEEHQHFSGNTLALDDWVLDHVEQFFRGSGNPQAYRKDGSLFFLHLLGQDTSGHTHKPKTERYRDNLRNVDRIVREVDKLFGLVFKDNATAFVLTADHGMTDWGSHGAGDPTETLTPIVAWGKGIRDNKNYKMEIQQADITPLLALLLGVSIPVNSIGILPVKFLDASQVTSAQMNLLNARQMSAQYLVKRSQVDEKSSFLQYKKFTALDSVEVEHQVVSIIGQIRAGNFADASLKNERLIQLSLQGLDFYQKYFQIPLFFLITLSYSLWILFLLTNISRKEANRPISSPGYILVFTLSLILCFIIIFEGLPVTYHAYVLLPIILSVCNYKSIEIPHLSLETILAALAPVVGTQLFVLGFFHRWVWSVVITSILSWPLTQNLSLPSWLFKSWVASGLALSVFTILPVVGKQPLPFLNFAASFLSVAIIGFLIGKKQMKLCLQPLLIFVSGCISCYVHSSFEHLGTYEQIVSWCLLVSILYFLRTTESDAMCNLFGIFSTLMIPFVLLSISHEVLFLLTLFFHLIVWIKVELHTSYATSNSLAYHQFPRPKLHEDDLSKTDLRRAYFFLSYIFIAFFGLGNLATLNSFDPAWVRCFLTTFSPFTMSALILLKVIIPFFAVSLAFRTLTLLLNISAYKIFILVLVYSNMMAVDFLFLVRTDGSWLDIGTSLSHYIIQQATILFLMLLHFASQLVIRNPSPVKNKTNGSHNP